MRGTLVHDTIIPSLPLKLARVLLLFTSSIYVVMVIAEGTEGICSYY